MCAVPTKYSPRRQRYASVRHHRVQIPRERYASTRRFKPCCAILILCIAEKALATLQGRPIPNIQPPVLLTLSPYPSTTPPTPLPPPSASPRLVKQLPSGYTDSQLYDLFRQFGALASVRTQAGFGSDTGVVEFWREDDARDAEEAMHCADVGGQNIAVQIYNPRKASAITEFSPNAPPFVPGGTMMPYAQQVPPQVRATLSTELVRVIIVL